MKIYTVEEVAEAAGVSNKEVMDALENKYLLPGFLTPYTDDRDKILGNYHYNKFIFCKGDTSLYTKWKGYFGVSRTINKYKVSAVRYRGAWLGVAIRPDGVIFTEMSSSREIAFKLVSNHAKNDTRFIKVHPNSKKGVSVYVSFTYDELGMIINYLSKEPTNKFFHTLEKLFKARSKSKRKKEGKNA